MDLGFLSDSHVLELRLFEIGGDPYLIQRHYGEELLPRLNVQSDDYCFIHFTSHGSDDLSVLEVQDRLLELRAPLLHVGDGRTHASPRG